MIDLHRLSRPQQILLGLGIIAIGTLLVLAIASFSSQVGTSLTGTFEEETEGTLMDDALEGTGEELLPIPETGTGDEGGETDASRQGLQLAPPTTQQLAFRGGVASYVR